MRIRFLVGYAGRSAVQAMLLRHPGTARPDWEALVPLVCAEASRDAGEHIRAARAAGAAPLDLANAAALLGLHAYGERLVVGPLPLSAEDRYRHAEMVDRVYETLAYELPRELVHELGNAPRRAPPPGPPLRRSPAHRRRSYRSVRTGDGPPAGADRAAGAGCPGAGDTTAATAPLGRRHLTCWRP
ncbi:MAG: hypothetical protein R2755_10865 [Acidimicrobiales bacterium]